MNPWELYTSVHGWQDVSDEIAAAVNRAKKAIDATQDVNPVDLAYKVWLRVVSPVLNRYPEYGASDTEPRSLTHEALERYAEGI